MVKIILYKIQNGQYLWKQSIFENIVFVIFFSFGPIQTTPGNWRDTLYILWIKWTLLQAWIVLITCLFIVKLQREKTQRYRLNMWNVSSLKDDKRIKLFLSPLMFSCRIDQCPGTLFNFDEPKPLRPPARTWDWRAPAHSS